MRRPAAWALLTLLSFFAVAPGLWRTGTNIVTQTYERAAQHSRAGTSLYTPPAGRGDFFKYSPFFAIAYRPFAALPDRPQALAWAFLNAAVFWWGMLAWFGLRSRASFVLAILCAMELDISLRYQQANALLAGLMLWGIAAYRDGRLREAGTLLALGTNLKVLPALFASALALPPRRFYLEALLGVSVLLLLLPFPFLGLSLFSAHAEWADVLVHDVGGRGLMDLGTALAWAGLGVLGLPARLAVLATSLWILFRGSRESKWGLWYTVGAGCLLLVSPRTESPTFILFAPAYFFLAQDFGRLPAKTRRIAYALLFVAAWALTLCFTDLWPKALWDPRDAHQFTKTFAVGGMWAYAIFRCSRRA